MESRNIAIVVAGGKGERIGNEIPKQFLELKGKPIIFYSLKAFEDCEKVDGIIVVIHPEFKNFLREVIEKYKLKKITGVVKSGRTRQESVFNGLMSVKKAKNVLIHDAARPLVSRNLILKIFKSLQHHLGVIPVIPIRDTIVSLENETVSGYHDREKLRAVQTPQGFKFEIILKGHQKAAEEGKWSFTDDASMLLYYKLGKVKSVEGEIHNIKITYPEDLQLAEFLLKSL